MNPIADFFNSAYSMTQDQMRLFQGEPHAQFQPTQSKKIKNKINKKRRKK